MKLFLSRRRFSRLSIVTLGLSLIPAPINASVESYDNAINVDAAGGLTPASRLTTATVFTGANRLAYNFGAVSGDATFEFVLQGSPAAITTTAYLAVGANTGSNLRYEQWQNTGQLGFTQLGVLDYVFNPGVSSPSLPTHVTYTWQASTLTMRVYINGTLAGTRSGVVATFAMPTGQGWLGGNPSGGELLTGTIHRLTVYDDLVAPEVILRHADAFNGVTRPPIIAAFTASPQVVFSPAPSTLSWQVQNAERIEIDGADVTALPNLIVTPPATTDYTLVATNLGGAVTGRVTVVVNPAPLIQSFTVGNGYAAPGQRVTLAWRGIYGEEYRIEPGVGDVTARTANGVGTVDITADQSTTFTLSAANPFGIREATASLQVIHPAGHLVISEFMAANESSLADEDGALSDWIEIFNPTSQAVNLGGYYLTDDRSNPTQWAFPSTNLPAGGYLIVFASGKDRRAAGAPLHTNFQLDRAGEYLALIGPGLALLHVFDPYPSQDPGVAYGLLGGDPTTARALGIPTPGSPNNGAPAPPARVEFSRPSGTFTGTFLLTLTCPTPGAIIRYTLNGSTPGTNRGTTYSSPILIDGTRHVRAVAITDGIASRVTGESYVRLAPDLAGYTSPLPILVIENFGAGVIRQKGWSGNGSGIKQVPRQSAIWATFDRVGGLGSLTNPPQMISPVGIRGRGAFSSQWRQKPFSVEAVDEEGAESAVKPLGLPAHPDWVLYFPDPDQEKDPVLLFNTFAYELSRNTGHYSVRFRWVEAFVNEDGGDLRLADRRGVYAIIEKVSRGRDRLNFTPLSEDGTSGSWLLNLNRMDPEPETGWPAENGATVPWFFHTAGQNRILQTPPNAQVIGDDEPQQGNGYLNFDNPNGYTINTAQRAAIEDWFRQFEDVLWNNALWRDPTNGYRKYLDPVDFADYFLMNTLTKNGDGLLISMFPWKADDGKLRMGPAWDYNWAPYYVAGSATDTLYHRPDRLWYRRLFADPDFAQLYIDRWWDHRRNGMSNADMDAIVDRQVAEITPAKALLNGMPSETEWATRINTFKTWLRDRGNWIDSRFVRPPTFSQNGGPVADGFQLAIFGTNGTIYFTTDGTDPRAPGGTVAAQAQGYQAPIAIVDTVSILARIRNGTNWSGLTRAVFEPAQNLSGLAVTEIMYNPTPFGPFQANDLEFIELKNTGPTPVRLGTLSFTAGVNFDFADGTRLAPGAFLVLARNQAAFNARYPGVAVHGTFSGQLDNAGETLRLSTAFGSTVLSVAYNDRAPWPLAADGYGFSAVPRTGQPFNRDAGQYWRASRAMGGSPGADDPEPEVLAVRINELLSRSVPPAVDWVELFNPNPVPVDIGGWFLSDDGGLPRKFRVPDGTSIPAQGYRVFTEADFNAAPGSALSFSFSSAGDAVYLTSGDANTNLTGYSHGFEFGAPPDGATFGRYVTSTGEEQFDVERQPTPASDNSGPRIGPIVLSEIQYHPAGTDPEFVELQNISTEAVPLFDPTAPTNTWRLAGLDYDLPAGMTLPPNGVLLITGIDPEVFRARYALPASTLIVGPFVGSLQDNGERLELQKPELAGTNGLLHVSIDVVRYNDRAPWPPVADGGGASLQRRVLSAYGNDPANWTGALPTPGAPLIPGAEPPSIVTQPADATVVATREATFSVIATGGAPLRYQWLFESALVPDATNATLVLSNVQPAQVGRYSAIVFNDAGNAQSAFARLSVRAPAFIVTQPRDVQVRIRPDTSAAPTTNATFSVLAVSSSPIRYQWRFNGQNLPGATNSTLTVTNVQLTNEGLYTAAVTDDAGTIFSAPALLQPWIAPYLIQAPLAQTVAASSRVALSVEVGGNPGPFVYEWRRGSLSLTTNTSPGRIDFFSFTATNVPQTNQYRVIVKNPANQSPGMPTPLVSVATIADTDGDGLPDEWETANGLNPASSSDRDRDQDGDGLGAFAEYSAGTDPNNAASQLKLDLASGTPVSLSFGAISNHTYSVEFVDELPPGSGPISGWRLLASIPARTTNRLERIPDPGYSTNRFYRVSTPGRTR